MKTSNKQTLRAIASTFIFSLLLSGIISAQSYFSDKVEKSWQTEAVFQVPESVYYDADGEMLYVANINGNPTDRDSKGYISQMEPDGRIVRLEWATGLHAPKGMSSYDGKLYVADIYRVAEIDLKTRKILNYYDADGAKFLNDVIADDDGNIYITDMSKGSVYKLLNGEIAEWLPAGTFDTPNGMYYLDGTVYLGANGKIVSIDPKSKEIKTLAEFEGGVDGLEIDMDGNFIFSDWIGKVQKVSQGGKPEVLFNTTDEKINAADIHLMREENILLVPTFFDNRVMAYKLVK